MPGGVCLHTCARVQDVHDSVGKSAVIFKSIISTYHIAGMFRRTKFPQISRIA